MYGLLKDHFSKNCFQEFLKFVQTSNVTTKEIIGLDEMVSKELASDKHSSPWLWSAGSSEEYSSFGKFLCWYTLYVLVDSIVVLF